MFLTQTKTEKCVSRLEPTEMSTHRRKMIPDGRLKIQEDMKRNRKGNYVGKLIVTM